MADSLATIDPNMDNGEEGKAFLKRMYRLRGVKAFETVYKNPETPLECVSTVAGKVIMIENLQEDINEAASFRDFFAKVYCQAYANSLVTLRDGLSQIFPGGLEGPIEDELVRISGGDSEVDFTELEMYAISAYVSDVGDGLFINDDTTLISAMEPVPEAMAICGAKV